METPSKTAAVSTLKHTPGPWIVAANSIAPAADPETEFPIAEIYGKANSAANARLIAAAPDMLAALNKCDTAFVAWQVGQIPGRPEDILALITEVRNAIAKAIVPPEKEEASVR